MKEEDPHPPFSVSVTERPTIIMAPQVFAERLERLEAEVKEMKKRQQEFEAKIEEREKFRQELEKIKDSREKERIALFSIICSLIVALVMLLLRFI